MDRSLNLEAARALADAREALAEWIEEGIDTWEAVPEPAAAPQAAPSFQLSPAPPRLAASGRAAGAPGARNPGGPGDPSTASRYATRANQSLWIMKWNK